MAIALNAGSNPNGQTPSVGAYGEGNGEKNSLLGNFSDLLNLISIDAENALYENKLTSKMTAEQTSEALIAFAGSGNEDAKLAISTILQRVTSENNYQLNINEGIPTSSFLEAKIENRLGQQNLLKPTKIIEFLSVADLKVFVEDFLAANGENFVEIALLNRNDGPISEYDGIPEMPLAKTTDFARTTLVSEIQSLTDGDPITTILDTENVNGASPQVSLEKNLNSTVRHSLTEKKQTILDAVKDILKVNSASLEIGNKVPSEVIFDLRDLKEAIAIEVSTLVANDQGIKVPMEEVSTLVANDQGIKVPMEMVIPYTLPVNVQNELTESLPVDMVENKFDILEVTKITLDKNLIELPLPGEANDIENTHTEQKSFTVKGGELLLNATPTSERKLVIGIAIPKNSIVDKLPDFVKIQINSVSREELAVEINSNPKINKEYLTSNLIKLPKGQLNDDNPIRLAKNMEILLTALGEKNNDRVDDTHIVSINKSSKLSQQTLPNLARIELVDTKTPPNNFIKNSFAGLSSISEQSATPKPNLHGIDRLSVIVTTGLNGVLDGRKQSSKTLDTTSTLALGPNISFINNKDLWRSGPKEKFANLSEQSNITTDGSVKSIFEMLNTKSVSRKLLGPAEIKKIFQSQNNLASLAPAGDKPINQLLPGSERNISTNNSPNLPSLFESKISLYEAQYASRLGMAVIEKARAGQENFDIHLTPESFGKIKVNVNLDFRAMDVKIFTETLGAAAIFKDHENTLQQIMEQNGMKLASFSVGSQNSNDQQRQFGNQNKDRTTGKVAGRGNKDLIASDMLENSKDEPSGLNLIA